MKALLDSKMRIGTIAKNRFIHGENSFFLCDDADFADFTDAVVVFVDCLFVQKLIYWDKHTIYP